MKVETKCCINHAAEVAVQTAASAGLAACGAHLFKIIDPVHAAVFGGASYLTHLTLFPLFEQTFGGPFATDASRLTGSILSIGTAIAISSGVATLLGVPVSINAGLAIACSMVAVGTLAALARQMVAVTVVS